MNFFERQHAARSTTLRLVLLFSLAVVTIVVAIDVVVLFLSRGNTTSDIIGALIAATVFTLLLIGGGTLAKTIALRAGGAAVARSVGAVPVDPTTSDPVLRRFVNIVEEMSIASGVPAPRLFVLEQEEGINAFAAGYTTSDAAITVTGGALRTLNRDELQGVIGHEFSHVLNGDMRLNVRLIALLYGILLLGLVGLRFLAFGGGGGRDRRDGVNPVLVIALAMLVLGFIGQFFAGLIQAAVSRQREWLADASAVQFTRQTSGLAGALKKIAGLPAGSALRDTHSEKQINHMLFGEGAKSFSQLRATHPPLLERIRALEPGFDGAQLAALQRAYDADPPDAMAEDAALGLVGGRGATAPRSTTMRVQPAELSNRVGTFSPEDLDRGRAISGAISPQLRQLAGQPSTAMPLLLALLLDPDRRVAEQQLQIVAARMSPTSAAATRELAGLVDAVDPMHRLPLASLAIPVVVARPPAQARALVETLDAMAAADGTITLFEYCLTRLVAGYVRDSLDPVRRSRRGRSDVRQVQDATLTLLAVVAAAGNEDHDAAAHAFTAAVAYLLPGLVVQFAPPSDCAAALDGGWDVLDALAPRAKQQLVEALVVAIRDDGVVTVAEAELLRATCGLLHCPLPALLG